jgi:hypothetical protein
VIECAAVLCAHSLKLLLDDNSAASILRPCSVEGVVCELQNLALAHAQHPEELARLLVLLSRRLHQALPKELDARRMAFVSSMVLRLLAGALRPIMG